MKTSGKILKAIQLELGVPPAVVAAKAEVSIATLYNVYADKPVGANYVNRVRRTLINMQNPNNFRTG